MRSKLQDIRFSKNEVTDEGISALLEAIEDRENNISALHFDENRLTDESAFMIFTWLKKQRMRDVSHSFNVMTFDIDLNKILIKNLKDVAV